MFQVGIGVDFDHILGRAEQQAFMKLGADHLQEQRRSAIRVGKAESAAKRLSAKVVRDRIVDTRVLGPFDGRSHLVTRPSARVGWPSLR